MQKRQERKLNMYLVVQETLGKTTDANTMIPKFDDNIAKLGAKIALIESVREKQELQRGGVKVSKQDLKNNLIDLAVDMCRKVMAYAVNESKSELAAEVDYNKSDLNKSADTILRDKCQVIHDRTQAHIAVLGDYGITITDLAALQTAITSYKASIPLPRTGIISKKDSTAQLEQLFTETDALLEKMDTLTEMVRKSKPDFYTTYKNSRLLTNVGYRKLALKGSFKTTNGAAVADVGYTIDGVDGNFKGSAKGNFQMKSLAAGSYTLRYSKAGFENGSADFTIDNGFRTDLKLVLR